MTRTVQLNCPIKAEIRAVDSQSDLRIFVIVMIIVEIVPKSLFLCVNRSHIRYGFHAGAKDIRYCVNMAMFSEVAASLCYCLFKQPLPHLRVSFQ